MRLDKFLVESSEGTRKIVRAYVKEGKAIVNGRVITINGLFPVGRLDKDTEGLLFLTNDGEFDHQLMCPGEHVEKKYFFWAFGLLGTEDTKRLETGICIRENETLTKPAKLK